MQVRKTEFYRFAGGEYVFVIPVYQRNYDWNKENCKQLFFDILNDMYARQESPGKDVEGHFIGTICVKMDGKYDNVIVDGQQRLTTLMLLLRAIYDTTKNEFIKRKIKAQFLVNEFEQNEVKVKLKPIKRDEGIYNKLIIPDAVDIESFNECDKKSNILKNYLYLKQLVEQEVKEDQIESFLEALKQLEVVELSLDHENPQVIFESLNSTGLDLTNTDLLRNYLLMALDYKTQERMYREYWAKIEEMVGAENMEMFMLHYLLLKTKSRNIQIGGKQGSLSSSTLYYAFKKYFSNINDGSAEKVEVLFKDLLHYADCYQFFIFNNDQDAYGGFKKYFYELFYCLEQQDAAVHVLYLTDHLKNGTIDAVVYIKVLQIMISFAARSVVCKRTGFSKQSSLLLQKIDEELKNNTRLIKELKAKQYNEYIAMWWRAFASGKGSYSFPKDEEFKTALECSDLYRTIKSKKCKYLLMKMESQKNPKECLSYSQGTVEHIMPRTLSDGWKKYLNARMDLMNYEQHVNTLGNLTLTGHNSELGNELFETKCANYRGSNYSITRDVAKYKSWSSKEIQLRAKELSAVALKVWPLPSEYNKSQHVDTGITYNLKTDLSSFSWTKPDVVSVLGEEMQITNWSDMVVFVCRSLYLADSELFVKAFQTNIFRGKRQYLYEEKPEQGRVGLINESPKYYIYTNNSTADNLQLLKDLIDYFDEELDTNLIDEVWFTLRKV